MLIRSTFSTIFAASLTLALVPLGCGAAQEEYPHAPQPQQQTASATKEWVMPEEVVEQWRGCVKKHASELRTYSHETKFELTVNNDGVVQSVNLRRSTLHHEAIESCLSAALEGLSIPLSMLPERASSEPFSGGESSRHSRVPLGIAQSVGGAIVALGPVILIAAGVTLGVFVAVAVTEETMEAVKRRNKVEKWCADLRDECLGDTRQPPGSDFGSHKDCGACFRHCKRHQSWPEDKCPRSN